MNCRQIDQPVQENTSPPAGGVTVIGFYKPLNRLISPFLLKNIFPGFSRQYSGNFGGRRILLLQDLLTGNGEVPVSVLPVVRRDAGKRVYRFPEELQVKKGNSCYKTGSNRSGLFFT